MILTLHMHVQSWITKEIQFSGLKKKKQNTYGTKVMGSEK
jgi:hypothetical protein